ncbi:MAG: hypothetical protein ABI779_13345 [Acidobacteriota bacterium]
MSSSVHGTSNTTGSSSSRIRSRRRHSRRARCLLHDIALIALVLLVGCVSAKPPACAKDAPRFDTAIYTVTGQFWFSHAVVTRGYHSSGIGSEELLSEPIKPGVAFRTVVRPAADCTINERTWRTGRPSNFRRISGRATVDREAMTVVVDCVCSIEPTDYDDPHGYFTLYR